MQNNLDPRDGLEPTARTSKDAPLSDQEVASSRSIPDVVHAWLDGEPVSDAALAAAPRDVAFWRKIDAELSTRRRAATPSNLQAEILAKLSESR